MLRVKIYKYGQITKIKFDDVEIASSPATVKATTKMVTAILRAANVTDFMLEGDTE